MTGATAPPAVTPIPTCSSPSARRDPALEQIEAAKAVCFQCEAQAACLEFAIISNQDSGVWGGTSEEERRVLRRRHVARLKAERRA